jgi:hypothetical protein
MDSIVRNLRVLWRAESIVADARLKQVVARIGLRAAAAALALFGFFMCNVAVFFALQEIWGPIWAAAAIGGANIALAIVLFVVAGAAQGGREMALAVEVRDMALRELETDAKAVQAQFAGIRDDVRGVQQAVGNFIRHPIDAALPQLIVPLAGVIIKALRKPGDKA